MKRKSMRSAVLALILCLLLVGCGKGALKILELTPESSKTMDAAAFLNGLRGEEIGK